MLPSCCTNNYEINKTNYNLCVFLYLQNPSPSLTASRSKPHHVSEAFASQPGGGVYQGVGTVKHFPYSWCESRPLDQRFVAKIKIDPHHEASRGSIVKDPEHVPQGSYNTSCEPRVCHPEVW